MSENPGQFNAAIPLWSASRACFFMNWQDKLAEARHVLIVGPTASGKSALALEIVARHGGIIVNADAIQVFANWQILTARPGADDLLQAPHRLYGHVAWDAPYSVGHWLRDLDPLLRGGERLVIIGGTGLYFTALTQGLAEIPPTPPEIRSEADHLRLTKGHKVMLEALDEQTRARLDVLNPMRVQRAWEVQQTTGRGLAAWQDDTPPPLLPLDQSLPLRVDVGRDWLNRRIARRFDQMLEQGALDEARNNLDRWDPAVLSMKAIGAPELIAHLKGDITLDEARTRATIATQQFAKRQRTWLRSKMKQWEGISAEDL